VDQDVGNRKQVACRPGAVPDVTDAKHQFARMGDAPIMGCVFPFAVGYPLRAQGLSGRRSRSAGRARGARDRNRNETVVTFDGGHKMLS
jgi:hypothetical protein